MADFVNVKCPACNRQFPIGLEFARVREAYCHCPYCATEFPPHAERSANEQSAGARKGAS